MIRRPPPAARDYLGILGVTPEMSRLPNLLDPATLGPTFHTANQADQRLYLGSGYDGSKSFDADPGATPVAGSRGAGFANAGVTRRHSDGSASVVRLDATQDGWIDYGGAPPRDFKVVTW